MRMIAVPSVRTISPFALKLEAWLRLTGNQERIREGILRWGAFPNGSKIKISFKILQKQMRKRPTCTPLYPHLLAKGNYEQVLR